MFDEPVRARAAVLLRPIARAVARAGITPNQISWLTLVVAVAAAVLVASGRPIAGVIVWLLSRVGDGLDGVLARELNHASAFGAYLDVTLDMAAYAAMVIGFAVAYPPYTHGWLAILAGYSVVMTSTLAFSDAARMLNRRIAATDRGVQFTPGLTEAGETSLMYVLWALWPSQIYWLVWIWAALLLLTAAQRTVSAARHLR